MSIHFVSVLFLTIAKKFKLSAVPQICTSYSSYTVKLNSIIFIFQSGLIMLGGIENAYPMTDEDAGPSEDVYGLGLLIRDSLRLTIAQQK